MSGKASGVKKSPVKKRAAGKSGKTVSANKAGKKSSEAGKSKQKKAKVAERDKGPFYVLAIMVLLTVIVLLINMFYSKNEKNEKDIAKKDVVSKEDSVNTSGLNKGDSESIVDLSGGKRKEKKRAIADHLKDNKIQIYFIKFNNNETMSLVTVYRNAKSSSYLRGALNELIKGPSNSEKERGLLTAVPANLRLRDISVEKGCATLDFNEAIERHANGSILLSRIDQIVYTVTQFKDIDSIIIKVNGKRKKFLGGEGLSLAGPIRRRKY